MATETVHLAENATVVCIICTDQPPKYKCPVCMRRTCSLACSKQHKIDFECTGVIDPTRRLPKEELSTPLTLNRDYNFLQTVGREIQLEKAGFLGKRARDQVRNGVKVRAMPPTMGRARRNRSGYNKSRAAFMWTIEVLGPDGQKPITTVPETSAIGNVVKDMLKIDEPLRIKLKDSEGVKFIVDPSKTLAEILHGHSVIEFPTLIARRQTEVDSDASVSEPESSPSSNTTSDSDSSSDSDSERDSNPETDSGSEPDEESARGPAEEKQETPDTAPNETSNAGP